jgi:hypothetical protein
MQAAGSSHLEGLKPRPQVQLPQYARALPVFPCAVQIRGLPDCDPFTLLAQKYTGWCGQTEQSCSEEWQWERLIATDGLDGH